MDKSETEMWVPRSARLERREDGRGLASLVDTDTPASSIFSGKSIRKSTDFFLQTPRKPLNERHCSPGETAQAQELSQTDLNSTLDNATHPLDGLS